MKIIRIWAQGKVFTHDLEKVKFSNNGPYGWILITDRKTGHEVSQITPPYAYEIIDEPDEKDKPF